MTKIIPNLAGMWRYDGWNSLNFIAEELTTPEKTFPRVLLTSIPLVTVLYVLTNISYLTVLSPTKLVNSGAVGVSFGATYSQGKVQKFSKKNFQNFVEFKKGFAIFIIFCVAISTFGAANGATICASRLAQVNRLKVKSFPSSLKSHSKFMAL